MVEGVGVVARLARQVRAGIGDERVAFTWPLLRGQRRQWWDAVDEALDPGNAAPVRPPVIRRPVPLRHRAPRVEHPRAHAGEPRARAAERMDRDRDGSGVASEVRRFASSCESVRISQFPWALTNESSRSSASFAGIGTMNIKTKRMAWAVVAMSATPDPW
jgi:hypothetical protein